MSHRHACTYALSFFNLVRLFSSVHFPFILFHVIFPFTFRTFFIWQFFFVYILLRTSYFPNYTIHLASCFTRHILSYFTLPKPVVSFYITHVTLLIFDLLLFPLHFSFPTSSSSCPVSTSNVCLLFHPFAYLCLLYVTQFLHPNLHFPIKSNLSFRST